MNNDRIDLRVFRRYPKEAEFSFNLRGASYNARTVDYSLNSIGIIIEASPQLVSGETVDLDIPALGIRQQGKVVWTTKHAHAVRAGIERLGQLNGTLLFYRLSDILTGLQRTLKTGILEIRQEGITRKIFFRNGNMVFAASDCDSDRIGNVLLKEGMISQEQFHLADERKKKTNERYVFILSDMGLLKPSDLIKTIELQANRIIESLFGLTQADFEFLEGPLPSNASITLHISAADIIYRELKKTTDLMHVTTFLLDRTVDFSPTPLNLFQDIRLDSADRMLLAYVDGKTSVRDLVSLSSMSREQAISSIFALIEARILEVKSEGETPQGIMPDDIGSAADETFGGLIDKIDEVDMRFRQMNYYDILGIDRGSSPDNIKKAYYRAAKEYHPDRNLSLPEDVKGKLLNIFRFITNAYVTLKDYEKRKEYDLSLRGFGPGVTQNGEMATASAAGESQRNASGRSADAADITAEKARLAKDNFEEGKTKFRKGSFDDAAHFFAVAIYYDNSQPQYHYYYGLCCAKSDKPKEALQSLNRALEISPNIPDILAEAGHVYLTLNCSVRAKGLFDKALRLSPGHKRAFEGTESIKHQKK